MGIVSKNVRKRGSLGYKKSNKTTVVGICYENVNMNDSTVYYGGNHLLSTTWAAQRDIIIPCNGTIYAAYVNWYHITQNCTTEDTVIAIRKNDTTDYTFYTGSMAQAATPASNTGLAIPIAAGDKLQLKITTPAWVTNPQGTRLITTLLIQY